MQFHSIRDIVRPLLIPKVANIELIYNSLYLAFIFTISSSLFPKERQLTLLAAMVYAGLISIMCQGMSNDISKARTKGVLHYLRLTPTPFYTLWMIYFFINFIMVLISSGILLLSAYYVQVPIIFHLSGICSLLLLLFFASILFGVVGSLLSFVQDTDTQNDIVSILTWIFPVISGAYGIPDVHAPLWIQNLVNFNPISIFVQGTVHAITNQPVNWIEHLPILMLLMGIPLLCLRFIFTRTRFIDKPDSSS